MWSALVFVVVIAGVNAQHADLQKCCRRGAKNFVMNRDCIDLERKVVADPIAVSEVSCIRTARICCLRQLQETNCRQGKTKALMTETCPVINNLPGELYHKECCDCCLLGKEVSSKDLPCLPPPAFSSLCKEVFGQCCADSDTVEGSGGGEVAFRDTFRPFASCSNDNPCEHICQDVSGTPNYMCSCRPGYTLDSDGYSCYDIDECEESSGLCSEDDEECVNLAGSFTCLAPLHTQAKCELGYEFDAQLMQCVDLDECQTDACNHATENCTNLPGSFECTCLDGFKLNSYTNQCEDIDECSLLLDDCTETQRCYNSMGSYKCLRTLSCGTGYYLHGDENECRDIDECEHGTHNCGPTYACRNIDGSFRCELKQCEYGTRLDSRSGDCVPVYCPPGLRPSVTGECEDDNECLKKPMYCAIHQECINTVGSFYCQDIQGFCEPGHRPNPVTGKCEDVDECTENPAVCSNGQSCLNTVGSFRCECPVGYLLSLSSGKCEDTNECEIYRGRVCPFNSKCVNTLGSFECSCVPGYRMNEISRICEDMNECVEDSSICEHRCINIPGSFQCVCERGYQLEMDGRSCKDINECADFGDTSAAKLCVGSCINTPGSYRCECPSGFHHTPDEKSCTDINECIEGLCSEAGKICVNIIGSYQCVNAMCPPNYVNDANLGNKCNLQTPCAPGDTLCLEQTPLSISFNHVTLPNKPKLSRLGTRKLFVMNGPFDRNKRAEFSLEFKSARASKSGRFVKLAQRSSFLLQSSGYSRNSVKVELRESLQGPQEVHLGLTMDVFQTGRSGRFLGRVIGSLVVFVSEYGDPTELITTLPLDHEVVTVEDGWSCVKKCQRSSDVSCYANNTHIITYQIVAVPSIPKEAKFPIKLTTLRAQSIDNKPFYVNYAIEDYHQYRFGVIQEGPNAHLVVIGALKGPEIAEVRLHIYVYDQNNVLSASNIAIVHVIVSEYFQ